MTHSHLLSPTQQSVVSMVTRFGQSSASQLRRALYRGTKRGVAARSSKHFKALSERGAIKRLPYKLSGHLKGSGEFVYAPPESKARIPNLHQLDTTELFVRLIEHTQANGGGQFQFLPEPWCWDSWGGVQLKPDFYAKVGRRHFLGEVDYETEYAGALSAKMNAYLRAYYGMDGGSFPLVLFICHTPERRQFIRRQIDKKSLRALFDVYEFDEAIPFMTT
jgi:hypothetical protein